MNENEFFIPNSSKKLDNIQILEAGPNPGILYSIVDEGTRYNKYFDKTSHTVRMLFEFPLLKQLFNEGDTEERPTVVSQEYTFTIGETSNLKKFIDGAEGRSLQPAEYRNGWNLGQYLGRIFMVDIVNKPNKKDPSIIYNNIGSVKALTDSLRNKYNFEWEKVTRINPILSFMIDPDGKCFESEAYTKLPPYLRKKTKESDEGIRFENNGGLFADRKQFKSTDATEAPIQRKATPPATKTDPNAPIKKMLVTDYTYEEYKASDWTDEQLVEHGKMEIIMPAKTNPAPSGPSGPGKVADNLDVVDANDDGDVPF